jgi:signal transduction histidine kinase
VRPDATSILESASPVEVPAPVQPGRDIGAALSAGDLADLMSAFNAATGRLQSTHERLQREVVRLRAELGEANRQIERSRRLAALGEMAAGIAHEVRNPLGSIALYARMLDEDLSAARPGDAETARKILRATRGLDAVVGDVLSFAREIKVHPDATDASEAFDAAVDACRGATDSTGVMVVRRDRGKGIGLFADASLLQRALVNVIRNAIEAARETPGEHGEPRVTLDAVTEGEGATLTIADSGPGIPRDALERLFNPFFTTRAAGTGLGLAIVHRIVDAHGGRIAVKPTGPRELGGGAVFELTFPAAKAGRAGLVQPTQEAIE